MTVISPNLDPNDPLSIINTGIIRLENEEAADEDDPPGFVENAIEFRDEGLRAVVGDALAVGDALGTVREFGGDFFVGLGKGIVTGDLFLGAAKGLMNVGNQIGKFIVDTLPDGLKADPDALIEGTDFTPRQAAANLEAAASDEGLGTAGKVAREAFPYIGMGLWAFKGAKALAVLANMGRGGTAMLQIGAGMSSDFLVGAAIEDPDKPSPLPQIIVKFADARPDNAFLKQVGVLFEYLTVKDDDSETASRLKRGALEALTDLTAEGSMLIGKGLKGSVTEAQLVKMKTFLHSEEAGEVIETMIRQGEAADVLEKEIARDYGVEGVKWLHGGVPMHPKQLEAYALRGTEATGRGLKELRSRALGVSSAPPPVKEPAPGVVSEIIDANFKDGRVLGLFDVPVERLGGGVRKSDPLEQKKIAELRDKMLTEEGFFERIVVGTDNNVIEGQHRLEAARQLGLQTVPVVRVGEITEGYPRADMLTAIKKASNLHPDQQRGIVRSAIEAVEESGSAEKALIEWEQTPQFQAAFEAAINAIGKAE